MKYLVVFVMIFFTVACAQGVKDVELKTFDDSVSYSIGADIARNFKAQEILPKGEIFHIQNPIMLLLVCIVLNIQI